MLVVKISNSPVVVETNVSIIFFTIKVEALRVETVAMLKNAFDPWMFIVLIS